MTPSSRFSCSRKSVNLRLRPTNEIPSELWPFGLGTPGIRHQSRSTPVPCRGSVRKPENEADPGGALPAFLLEVLDSPPARKHLERDEARRPPGSPFPDCAPAVLDDVGAASGCNVACGVPGALPAERDA